MVIVQVAPGTRVPTVQVTSFPTFPQAPALATIPVIANEPGAGIESVTTRLSASDGPLFVTVIT